MHSSRYPHRQHRNPLAGVQPADPVAPDPRDLNEPPPALVQARVRRTALVPTIISVACPAHEAAVGEYCYRHAHGVCAERIIARVAKR